MKTIPSDKDELFEKSAIAIFASAPPSGRPHVAPVWVDYVGTHVLVVTRTETRKYKTSNTTLG